MDNNSLVINIVTGVPGSGKTTTVLREAARVPGRYLLAAPRCDLVDEHAATLLGAPSEGSPSVTPVHSGAARVPGRPAARESTGRRIEAALSTAGADGHAVVLVTHESLSRIPGDLLRGWHVVIDEVPTGTVVASGSLSARTSAEALALHYELESCDIEGWSRVRARPERPIKRGAIVEDGAGGLSALHQAAQEPGRVTLADLTDWDEAAAARHPVRWASVWDPGALRGCASVTIAAAGFSGSLAERAWRALAPDVVFEERRVERDRTAQPRVVISYYAGAHRGSTSWWATDEGSWCLAQVSKHLEATSFPGYLTTNLGFELAFKHRFPGALVSPRQEGTNGLIDHRACAAIYSCKATGADVAMMEVLGIDREAIRRAREVEDLAQFVLRGAIRRPDYGGDYDVRVYDRWQAEEVAAYLRAAGFARVEVVGVPEAGIMEVRRSNGVVSDDLTRPPPGRCTREERRSRDAARKRAGRAAARTLAVASGTHRCRGRPRRREAEGSAA